MRLLAQPHVDVPFTDIVMSEIDDIQCVPISRDDGDRLWIKSKESASSGKLLFPKVRFP